MGAGSFKADVAGTYESCVMCDDGTVGGAAGAGWSLVNCLPPACVWHFFMIPANNTKGDILPFGVAAIFGFLALIPVAATFVALVVPGAIAAGIGALVGLFRGQK